MRAVTSFIWLYYITLHKVGCVGWCNATRSSCWQLAFFYINLLNSTFYLLTCFLNCAVGLSIFSFPTKFARRRHMQKGNCGPTAQPISLSCHICSKRFPSNFAKLQHLKKVSCTALCSDVTWSDGNKVHSDEFLWTLWLLSTLERFSFQFSNMVYLV